MDQISKVVQDSRPFNDLNIGYCEEKNPVSIPLMAY